MAEVIAALGVIASVAQLADYGFKLSVKLYTFSETAHNADKAIKSISTDVSLTSTVLQELSKIIQADESRVVSQTAIEVTHQTVQECLIVFEQLNDALDKSLGNTGAMEKGKKVKKGMATLEKLKWPFKQPKMDLLRSNLDRLKASLTLMLQVLSYAKDISNQKAAESSLAYQQQVIESLARSERAMKRRYYALQHAIENSNSRDLKNPMINTSVHIPGAREIDDLPPIYHGTPAVKPKIIVGELLLCFQLLNDLLGYHLTVTKYDELSTLGYDNLRIALEKIQLAEIKRLEAEYGVSPIELKKEAERNVQTRLRELAKAGYLKQRVLDEIVNTDTPAENPIVSRPEAISYMETSTSGVFVEDPNPVPVSYSSTIESIPAKKERIEVPQIHEGESKLGHGRLTINHPETSMSISSPPNEIPASFQSQIDEVNAIMNETITNITQHGERLDSLGDKTDNLAVSAQGFRRGPNRTRKMNPLAMVYNSAALFGSQGLKSVQVLGEKVYEAGAKIFGGGEGEVEKEEWAGEFQQKIGRAEDEEDWEEGDENLVEDLMAKWTTLPKMQKRKN